MPIHLVVAQPLCGERFQSSSESLFECFGRTPGTPTACEQRGNVHIWKLSLLVSLLRSGTQVLNSYPPYSTVSWPSKGVMIYRKRVSILISSVWLVHPTANPQQHPVALWLSHASRCHLSQSQALSRPSEYPPPLACSSLGLCVWRGRYLG